MLHESTTVAPRRLALARLDQEFHDYQWAILHPARAAKQELPAPIGTIEAEARSLVSDRYRPDSQHALYAGHSTDPSCQRDCDDCHRVLALVQIRELCGSRAEYTPLLNWILDPAFLI